MTEIKNAKRYDLEDRTFEFAKKCGNFIRKIPKTIANIEANESLSKKDFVHRVKICRKEAKETRLWLRLCESSGNEREELIKEVTEIMKIFGSILEKCK